MISKNWLNYNPEMDFLSEKTQSLLKEAVQSTEDFIKVSPELSNTDYATRGAHARSYAYVNAKFTPNDKVIASLGIENFFYADLGVILRFSNANNVIISNKKNFPAYGMSLSFENGINYPMVNFPLFPTDDVDSFLKLFIDLNNARIKQAENGWKAITELPSLLSSSFKAMYHINPLNVGNLLWKGITLDQDFILNYSYHGIGCYRMGNYVVKIHTERNDFKFNEDIKTSNLQKENLENILNQESIKFNIYVQIANDEQKTPVNILSKEWNEETAPMLKFGEIHIPRQQVIQSTPALENKSFSPFINPKVLQPVGRIQQTRKKVYEVSVSTRNKLNNN